MADPVIYPKPSVGRIAHYYPKEREREPFGDGPIAATITLVHDETACDLFLMLSMYSQMDSSRVEAIDYSEHPKAGHWSWPPRV